MKRFVVLAALGLVLAGCGAGHKAVSNVTTLPRPVVDMSSTPERLVVGGTATIPHAKTGTEIACKGGYPTVTVPAAVTVAGEEVGVDQTGGPASGPNTSLRLLRSSDGTVTVTCHRK